MEVNKAAAVVGLTLAVLGGGIGYHLYSQTATAGQDGNTAGERAARETPAGGLTATVSELRAENADLKKRLAELETRLSRQPLDLEPDPPKEAEPEEEAATDEEVHAAFMDESLRKVLDTVDWTKIGTNMQGMVPLLDELAKAMRDDPENIPLDLAGKIQQMNGVLLAQAQALTAGDVPGTGVNGAFTHPVMAANEVYFALKAAGTPLTESQTEALQKVMGYYSGRDASLRIDAAGHELSIETLAAEMEMKDAFYKEVDNVLGTEQRNAIRRDTSGGRIGLDLFSSGIGWAPYAAPVKVKDAADLANQVRGRLVHKVGLNQEQAVTAKKIIDSWANSIPEGYWANKADKLELVRFMRTKRVQQAARKQIQLFQRLMKEGNLTEKQRKTLAKQMVILVPLPR